MKKQDQSPVAASEEQTTSSANSGELFDETLSRLVQAWEINVDNIDISVRVAEVIAAETVVPPIGSEPIQIPDEFVPYLQENNPAEPRLMDFSGIPVSLLKLPVLTIEQEKRLARAIEQERSWGIDVLVNANQHLVYTIIKRYEGKSIDLEELIQAGMDGLKKAVYRFDYHQGVRFSTFATHWIQQEITRLVDSRTVEATGLVSTTGDNNQVPSDLAKYLAEDLKGNHSLTAEQEKRAGIAMEQGNKPWGQTVLINANRNLVHVIARRHQDRGVDREELIREGMIGLTRAVDRFDYRRGNRFAPFATHWIQQAMEQLIDSRTAQSATIDVSPEVASRSGVPFIDLTKHKPEPEALSVLTAEIALKYRALPVKRDGNRLWVAMQNVRDIAVVDAVRMASRCLVQPMVANPMELDKAITEAYGSLEPPQPPAPPTANAAPAPEPYDETSQLLRETLSELRGMRDELSSLRREVAELRRDRSAFVPRPSTARLFPFAPENVAHRNR